MSEMTVQPQRVKDYCIRALEKVGMGFDDARIAAEVLVTADMRGTTTHGTIGLKGYVRQIREGGMNPKADIEIVREGPTWAVVDGHSGLGVVTSYKATKLAIVKAKANAVSMVWVKNSNHFAAAGYYAMMCAEADMIGLAMTNANISLSAPGSAGRVIGNNPFAYGAPAGKAPPVNLDIAMGVVAGGKVHAAAREGRSIPLGWAIDGQGVPTTDPREYEEKGGATVPLAGHKGFGLALLIEILAGVMTGGGIRTEVKSYAQHPESPSDVGHFFMAIDTGTIMPIEEFRIRMDSLITGVSTSPKAQGTDRIYLPGEIELEREEKAKKEGFVLDDGALNSLKELGQDLGLEDERFWHS
jgi:LDH2 family malate/lactate/ureidoglycolate dehydrogenase